MYVWVTGQDDNLGDSLLRRGYVDALAPIGELSVWVRGASPDFVTGLGLRKEGEVARSFAAWTFDAFRSTLRSRTIIALNAGEMVVSGRGAAKLALLTVLILCARIRGGGGVWVGAGVPKTGRKALLAVYRAAAKACAFVSWRDAESVDLLGVGTVTPDWAFGLGDLENLDQGEPRDVLGVVLRGDRPAPSEEWWDWIDAQADSLGLRPTMIVQVSTDTKLAASVAARRGYDVFDWPRGRNHSDHESEVRALYRRCALVVGDRLHGLVVAATEGAVPLGWVTSSRGKIRRHFDAAGITIAGEAEGAPASSLRVLDPSTLEAARTSVWSDVERARTTITNASIDMRQQFSN